MERNSAKQASSAFACHSLNHRFPRPTVRNIFQCRSDGRSDVFWSLPMM